MLFNLDKCSVMHFEGTGAICGDYRRHSIVNPRQSNTNPATS